MTNDLIAILIGVVLVNGLVLPAFPAAFPGAAAAGRGSPLPHLALLTPLAAAPAALAGWLAGRHLLGPARLPELQPLLTLLVAVAAARLASRAWQAARGRPHPGSAALLTLNAAAAALAPAAAAQPASAAGALLAGAGAGALLGLLNLCFAGLCERLGGADLPGAWRGAGIALISAGILSLGLGGLAGLWHH